MERAAAKQRSRRTRRSTEEIVELLIEAAVEEFEEKGYSGATTAAIAKRADVTEALLFKHFGSKSQLFKATVFGPLSQLFDQFLQQHDSARTDPLRRREDSLNYIGQIQDLIASHPRMFLSLLFAQAYKSSEVEGLADISALHDYFSRSADMAAANYKLPPPIDPELMARISFTTIMSCTVFQDWLFPDGRWSMQQIREAVSGFVMDGLNVNMTAR